MRIKPKRLWFKVCFYELWKAGGLWSGCSSWCWISSQLCSQEIKVWLAFLICDITAGRRKLLRALGVGWKVEAV